MLRWWKENVISIGKLNFLSQFRSFSFQSQSERERQKLSDGFPLSSVSVWCTLKHTQGFYAMRFFASQLNNNPPSNWLDSSNKEMKYFPFAWEWLVCSWSIKDVIFITCYKGKAFDRSCCYVLFKVMDYSEFITVSASCNVGFDYPIPHCDGFLLGGNALFLFFLFFHLI